MRKSYSYTIINKSSSQFPEIIVKHSIKRGHCKKTTFFFSETDAICPLGTRVISLVESRVTT